MTVVFMEVLSQVSHLFLDLTPAQFGDALLASKTVEYDANLLFGSKPAARLPSDLAHCRFARLVLSCRHKDTLLGDAIPAMCLLV